MFEPNQIYSRLQVYKLLNVPEEKRRGNWETGYNSYGEPLHFLQCRCVRSVRSRHDNRWLDDGRFQWFAKERTSEEKGTFYFIMPG